MQPQQEIKEKATDEAQRECWRGSQQTHATSLQLFAPKEESAVQSIGAPS